MVQPTVQNPNQEIGTFEKQENLGIFSLENQNNESAIKIVANFSVNRQID